ncbi:MAG: YicC family protein [Oscillospiraceae bacterium]|nr:YicC family protein [Oscillospiraceae bacterium]
MVYSMTGYGKGNRILGGKDITVEVKSVNHRYFEYSGRLPRHFMFLDDRIKKEIQSKISRGKIEMSLTVRNVDSSDTKVERDIPLARSYYDALESIRSGLGLINNTDVARIASFDGVLVRVKNEEDTEQLWHNVRTVLNDALDEFVAMRAAEGEKLREDVLSKLSNLERMVMAVEEKAPERVAAYRERLYAKLREVLEDRQIDDARIVTEAAIFADKVAVDEETTRLHSHIAQFRTILDAKEPRGKKLDFLVQEINRETNTIGSKSNDLTVTGIVVDMKSEIEKIREQIQNIE